MAYDLRVAKVPRVTGVALSALAGAVENPLTASLIMPKLFADSGIADLRTARVDEPPSVLPPMPRPATLPAGPPAVLDLEALVRPRPAGEGFAFSADKLTTLLCACLQEQNES